MKKILFLFTLAASALFLAGCATPGYKKADTASTSLQDAAQGIDNLLAPIDRVVADLSDLVTNPAPDLTPQFQKFSASVATLDTQANEVSRRAAAMQAEGAAYFQKWDAELAKIQNDDIQSRSQERKREVASQFQEVRGSYVETNAELAAYVAEVKDIRTALATDLTAAGLRAVKRPVENANDKAPSLRESLLELSAEFKRLGVSLSTGTTAR